MSIERLKEWGVKNRQTEHFKKCHCESEYRRRYREKINAYEAYGGAVCACCGEDELGFLTLDHVNCDGAKHRKEHKTGTGVNLCVWLKRNGYPPGFQVLCFNCNNGRQINGGVCPHKAVGHSLKSLNLMFSHIRHGAGNAKEAPG